MSRDGGHLMGKEMTGGAFYARQPLLDRIWSRLGFGHAYAAHPEDEDHPEFSEGHIVTDTISVLDWFDRLRVLVSGKVMVQTVTKTDVVVSRSRSWACFRTLPPNFSPKAQEDK